jgi:hypothetical protein
MDNPFSINFEWIGSESSDYHHCTFAEVDICLSGVHICELEDTVSKTVRPTMRVSAYALAQWLASNWWRIICEPERVGSSWEMSHKLGAIGEGYLWPDLEFCSDSQDVKLSMYPTPSSSREGVRYLNHIQRDVSLPHFEMTIRSFIESVIERLYSFGYKNSALHKVWEELKEELSNHEYSKWRRVEALLGNDPDTVSSDFVEDILTASKKYGENAVSEIISCQENDPLKVIKELWSGVRNKASSTLMIDYSDQLRHKVVSFDKSKPWEKAAYAARVARKSWSVPDGSVTNKFLSDCFGFLQRELIYNKNNQYHIAAGFRDSGTEKIKFYLNTSYEANRRFALMRIVGDHLYSSVQDKILPSTKEKTYRQKFQRAFAQEFLCPYHELKEFMGKDKTEDRIENAAAYFMVSQLLIRTVLVNKKELQQYMLNY